MRTRQTQNHDEPAVSTLLGVGVLGLVSILLIVATLARLVLLLEPGIGEMAVFNPQLPAGDTLPLRARVTIVDAFGKPINGKTCVLASDVMAVTGGSLVIEARPGGANPAYVVHWGGGPTSTGAANCGNDVDVLIAKQDLLGLVGSAGGFGLRQGARLAKNQTGAPLTSDVK